MRPKIAVDARMIGMGGIGRYVESLTAAMMRQRPDVQWILIGDPARLARLADTVRSAGSAPSVDIRACGARIYSAAEAFGMNRVFRGADLVHVPHFNAPFVGSGKWVVTIHDLIHLEYPEYQPFAGANRILDWKLARLLRRADGILTVSQATADALKRRYPSVRLDSKMRVAWEAADAVFNPVAQPDDAERLRRMGLTADSNDRRILYVGAIREHKDVHVLVEAFRGLTKEHPELQLRLVLSGKLDARYDRKRNFLSNIQEGSGILRVTDADDRDLAALYRSAAVLVLPSRVEGFGLPVVEAMRSGTPVIVSDAAALREIAGPAALVFPAGEAPALRAQLRRTLTDSADHERLVRAGFERVRLFDWSLTAQKTLEMYDTVLSSR